MGIVVHGVDATGRGSGIRGAAARRLVAVRIAATIIALGVLAACAADDARPQQTAVASAAPVQDLRSTPCEVVTRDMVSSTFAVAAADIEQSSMSSLCAYRWEGAGELLDVTLHVTAVADDAAQARLLFEQATAANFQEVAGLGDQARIDTGNGDVHVRQDRLYFTLNAYYGPIMPKLAPVAVAASAVDARADWWRSTIPQRQRAAMRLVRASVESGDRQ